MVSFRLLFLVCAWLLYIAAIVGLYTIGGIYGFFKGAYMAIKDPHPIDIVDYFAERNKRKGK